MFFSAIFSLLSSPAAASDSDASFPHQVEGPNVRPGVPETAPRGSEMLDPATSLSYTPKRLYYVGRGLPVAIFDRSLAFADDTFLAYEDIAADCIIKCGNVENAVGLSLYDVAGIMHCICICIVDNGEGGAIDDGLTDGTHQGHFIYCYDCMGGKFAPSSQPSSTQPPSTSPALTPCPNPPVTCSWDDAQWGTICDVDEGNLSLIGYDVTAQGCAAACAGHGAACCERFFVGDDIFQCWASDAHANGLVNYDSDPYQAVMCVGSTLSDEDAAPMKTVVEAATEHVRRNKDTASKRPRTVAYIEQKLTKAKAGVEDLERELARLRAKEAAEAEGGEQQAEAKASQLGEVLDYFLDLPGEGSGSGGEGGAAGAEDRRLFGENGEHKE